MAEDIKKKSSTILTPRDQEIVVAAIRNLKSGVLEVDYYGMATELGLKDARSATAAWAGVKKKLFSGAELKASSATATTKSSLTASGIAEAIYPPLKRRRTEPAMSPGDDPVKDAEKMLELLMELFELWSLDSNASCALGLSNEDIQKTIGSDICGEIRKIKPLSWDRAVGNTRPQEGLRKRAITLKATKDTENLAQARILLENSLAQHGVEMAAINTRLSEGLAIELAKEERAAATEKLDKMIAEFDKAKKALL